MTGGGYRRAAIALKLRVYPLGYSKNTKRQTKSFLLRKRLVRVECLPSSYQESIHVHERGWRLDNPRAECATGRSKGSQPFRAKCRTEQHQYWWTIAGDPVTSCSSIRRGRGSGQGFHASDAGASVSTRRWEFAWRCGKS